MEDIELPEPDDPDGGAGDTPEGASESTWSRRRLQVISTLATLLVAVSAVGLSIWEGMEMRRHNRLSVLPNLTVGGGNVTVDAGEAARLQGTSRTVDEASHIVQRTFRNTGLGPAVIKRALVFPAGAAAGAEPVEATREDGDAINLYSAPDSLVARMENRFPALELYAGSIEQGDMVKAGESRIFMGAAVPMASVPDTVTTDPKDRVEALVERYSFVACYCSVYGEDCGQAHVGAAPPAGNVCGF
jgi:hypothetical protein